MPGPVSADERSRIVGYFADGPGTGSNAALDYFAANPGGGLSEADYWNTPAPRGQQYVDTFSGENVAAKSQLHVDLVPGSGDAASRGALTDRINTIAKTTEDLKALAAQMETERALNNMSDMAAAYKASGMTGATGDATESLPLSGDRWYPEDIGGTMVGERMTAAEAAAFDAANGLGKSPSAAATGTITPIGQVEGFFTFNPAGRFAKGAAGAAYDAATVLPRAAVGVGNLVRDAAGYAGNALFPQRSALTGETVPYQPTSGLIQSFQRNGVAGTVGGGIVGAVRGAPGIGLVESLYAPDRDWSKIGAQVVNSGAVAVGATGFRRGSVDEFVGRVHDALRQNAAAGELADLRAIDPSAKVGLTGSAATGRVGNPNKATFGQPINPGAFDLDLFVQSDTLLEQFGSRLRPAPALRQTLVQQYPDLFEGLKPGKQGLTIKFRPFGDSPPGSITLTD